MFSDVFPGWEYWKTLGGENGIVELGLDVAQRDDAEGDIYERRVVRTDPTSDWEVAGSVHQIGPNAQGSIQFSIDADSADVTDQDALQYLRLLDDRVFAAGRNKVRFPLKGHPEGEVRAFPIKRTVDLVLSTTRNLDEQTRVLLSTTEYACVLVFRQ
jgi:hypothetical protein